MLLAGRERQKSVSIVIRPLSPAFQQLKMHSVAPSAIIIQRSVYRPRHEAGIFDMRRQLASGSE